jgi:hypothetical protein
MAETGTAPRHPWAVGRPGTDVDFDLHGFVGIRVLDAEDSDVAAVVRQLGPLVSTLHREPDITIRFVDRLEPGARLTSVGRGETAFTSDGMYVLKGKGDVVARALVPLQHVGQRCDIVCERRMPSVPLLLAIVNFTAVAHGVLPLHASAFEHEGRGIVVCGWAKGGKTEVLLSFMSRGARYVGDEWVYLVPDGRMFGVPEPIRLWDWQLRQLDKAWSGLPSRDRTRLVALRVAGSAVGRGATIPGRASSLLQRTAELLERQQWVQIPPAVLFGRDAIALQGRMDDLVLTSVHDSSEISLSPVNGSEIGARMRSSLRYERRSFDAVYEQFRFAFPSLSSEVVETASQREGALLLDIVPDRAWWVRHPYPVDIQSLYHPIHDRLHT